MTCIYCCSRNVNEIDDKICQCADCKMTMKQSIARQLTKLFFYNTKLADRLKALREDFLKASKTYDFASQIEITQKIKKIIPGDAVSRLYDLLKYKSKDSYYNSYIKIITSFLTPSELKLVLDIMIYRLEFKEYKYILKVINTLDDESKEYYNIKLENKMESVIINAPIYNLYPKTYKVNTKSYLSRLVDLDFNKEAIEYYDYTYHNILNYEVKSVSNNNESPMTCCSITSTKDFEVREKIRKTMINFINGTLDKDYYDNYLYELVKIDRDYYIYMGFFPQDKKNSKIRIFENDMDITGIDNASYCVENDLHEGRKYFKYKPIKWKIIGISEDYACLEAVKVIDCIDLDYIPNNNFDVYVTNFITNFKETAFNKKQRRIIKNITFSKSNIPLYAQATDFVEHKGFADHALINLEIKYKYLTIPYEKITKEKTIESTIGFKPVIYIKL